jgi:hypothetical protein
VRHWVIPSPTDKGLFAIVRGADGMHSTLVADGYGSESTAKLDARTLDRERKLSNKKANPGPDLGFPRGGFAPTGWEPFRNQGDLSLRKNGRRG